MNFLSLNDWKQKRKKYYEDIDANKDIPDIKIGQTYKGKKTGKVYIVYRYIDDEVSRIAMKRFGEKNNVLDTHLDMFEWDLLERI